MAIRNLHDLYVVGLQELRSAEAMLVELLPRMAALASHHQVREALESQLEEARSHLQAVDRILATRHADLSVQTDAAMRMLVGSAEQLMGDVPDPFLRDSCLIASAQLLVHHEIAAYRTATWLADALDLKDESRNLEHIVTDVTAAATNLGIIATTIIFPEAATAEVRIV